MLKPALLTALLGATMISHAHAETLFRGTMVFTAAPEPACEGSASLGDQFNSQFHPRSVAGNSDFSAITRIFSYGAISNRIEAADFTSKLTETVSDGIGWSEYKPEKPILVSVTSQSPANLTPSTLTVTLKGKMKNPFGNTGFAACVVDFVATYVNQQQ